MWAVPAGMLTRGVSRGVPITPMLGGCDCGSAIEPAAGGENACPAAGGANEWTIGAAGGGATGITGAGAGAAGAATPPTLPACATASCGMTASTNAVVKTRSLIPGMAPLLRNAPY
jgi:hypothetical protein